jgi:aryl-alcohol dehydrogenase
MRTTAVLVERPGGPFVHAEVELDAPRGHEVLVRIVATGLCHTDLTVPSMMPEEMFPKVLGHEGTGVVEAVGPEVGNIAVGDHVVISFTSCGGCGPCDEGAVGYCEQSLVLNYMGMRLDGSTTIRRGDQAVFGSFFGQSSFARHALADSRNCVVVDADLDLALLAPFGCGFQTGAGTVLNVIDPGPGETLVVFGVGAVGLAALAAAAGMGMETIVAVDPQPARRAEAERYGAVALDPTEEGADPIEERVKAATGGGAHFAIDTTALAPVVLQAQHALRPRGVLIALGLGSPEYTIDAVDLLQAGKIVRSSIEGEADPQVTIPQLIRMRDEGRFDVDRLVRRYPFDRIDEAIADAEAGRVVKPVLVW